MPLFGAHQSIAGGYYNALLAAQALGCETVQLFTSSPRRFPQAPAFPADAKSDDGIRDFKRTLRQTHLRQPVGHNSYLINVASPNPALQRLSVDGLTVELQRAETLGLRYLVMHPGSSVDGDEQA